MTDTTILIKKVEEKKISSKGNEELVQRVTLYTKDMMDYKAVSDIRKIKEKKKVIKEVAERTKIPKFGICKGQPRGSLEAGVIMVSKEEVKIINRETDVEQDMKDKLLESINNRKKNVLREMQEARDKENQEKLAKLFSAHKPSTIRKNRPRENSIKVSGFNPSYNEKDLTEIFEKVGQIKRVFIPRDFNTGHFKNFAFIDFYQSLHVKSACERLNDSAIDGCILSVIPADDK
jgi:hypothetical protein